MNISELSIRRPVLATVLTIIILLFGLIGYTTLGVREYPSVDNPIISVTCSYSGANADIIESQITEPLEQNINGIPGIRSLSSVSQQGQCRITVEFELSVDLETAANDVRDKVSRAQRYLPRDCDPPTVSKADADASPILIVAIQSNTRSLLELSEIADLTVKEQLQTISDVSSVSIWQRHARDAHFVYERDRQPVRPRRRRRGDGPQGHRLRRPHRQQVPLPRLRLRRFMLPEGREGAGPHGPGTRLHDAGHRGRRAGQRAAERDCFREIADRVGRPAGQGRRNLGAGLQARDRRHARSSGNGGDRPPARCRSRSAGL